MPRIRTIKPEFWSSPSIKGMDPWARLLFIAMWNWADDYGRGRANVRELASFAFPWDDDPVAPDTKEIPRLLTEISSRCGVVFYEVSGRRYYAIPTWDEHQRTERRAVSRLPAPDQQKQGGKEMPTIATELPPHSEGSTVLGSRNRGTGEQGNPPSGGARERTPARRTREVAPADESPEPGTVSAADVVRAWVDAANSNEFKPTAGMRNQVGKLGKELLADGNDPFRVIAAAEAAGRAGYATIDRELAKLSGRAVSQIPIRDAKIERQRKLRNEMRGMEI